MKKTITTVIFCIFIYSVKAQITHSIGLTYFRCEVKPQNSLGVTYLPQYRINSNFSVGIPLSLSFSDVQWYPGGDHTYNFMFSVPIAANFHFNFISEENKKLYKTDKKGLFFGAGYGIFYSEHKLVKIVNEEEHKVNNFVSGPYYNIGFTEKGFRIYVSCLKDYKSDKNIVWGIGFTVTIDNYEKTDKSTINKLF